MYTVGHGAVDFVEPTNGTLVANFEGTENVTTITCNITNGGVRISTQWSIENFRNVPGLQSLTDEVVYTIPEFMIDDTSTFRNRLIILVLSSELDGVIIYCGTGQQRRQANFPVRVYREFLLVH